MTDIAAARDELVDRGVGVGTIRHKDVGSGQWQGRFHLGADPQRADYSSVADFADPDGDGRVLREWFGQLVLYSMAVTLSDSYVDFFSLGQAVLRMTADAHHLRIGDDDLEALSAGMRTMPAHPDASDGLRRLKAGGYRLVTLTNSPPVADGPTPLENAGIAGFFERQFSVDTSRV